MKYSRYNPVITIPKRNVQKDSYVKLRQSQKSHPLTVNLESLLNSTYKDRNQKQQSFQGFVHDPTLSTDAVKTYFRKGPDGNRQLLISVAGTSLSKRLKKDVYTDLNTPLVANRLISPFTLPRYTEAMAITSSATSKYSPTERIFVGHSLGASVAQMAATRSKMKNDRVITLNGAPLAKKHASDEVHLRSKFDPVSIFNLSQSSNLPLRSTGFNVHNTKTAHNVQFEI